jgi:hypothetical protein
MSTRGMIGIRIGRKLLGFYNHFDSYPDGLGTAIVEWVQANLLTPEALATLKANALALKDVHGDNNPPDQESFDYYMGIPPKEGEDADLRAQIGGATRARTEWYGLLRNYQGIPGLDAILSGELKHFNQNSSFLKDSLFCEYAYIINLGKGTVEFYKGFQEIKGTENFGPCKKVGAVPFASLTVEAMKALFPKDED